jgi:hypothetical protein
VKVERAEAGFDIELHVLVMDRLSEHFLLGCEPDHAQLGVGGRKGRGKGREEEWKGIREGRQTKKHTKKANTYIHAQLRFSLVLSVAPDACICIYIYMMYIHDDSRERERNSERKSESERGHRNKGP